MADHTAIAAVSRSFVDLLRNRMLAPPQFGEPDPVIENTNDIELGSPDNVGSARLSVFLYRVDENPHAKNAENEVVTPQTSRPPPLTLDLHYLVTAHPTNGDDETLNSEDQHTILGRAMQVVRDTGTLGDGILQGTLADGPPLPIALVSPSSDEVSNVWSTFENASIQPSIAYVIGPVPIESTRETTSDRTTEQRTEIDYWRPETEHDEEGRS